MRVLLQRVSHASVEVEGQRVGAIESGLLLLVGVCPGDTEADALKLARKVVNMRIFNDEQDRFNLSLLDTSGGALVVSQFTLYADTTRGRRPAFTNAARPEIAEPLVNRFAQLITELGVVNVQMGRFGANMDVSLCNQGPVTIWLDSAS